MLEAVASPSGRSIVTPKQVRRRVYLGLPQTNIARRSASSAAAIIGAALRSFLGTGDHGGSRLMSSSNKATLAQMEVVAVAVAPSFPFAMPPKRQILCS